MTLVDGLVVLAVLASIGFLIWTKLDKNNSPIIQKSREWIKKTTTPKVTGFDKEKMVQTYSEKRQIM